MAMYFLRLPWVACWRGGLSKGRRTPRICPKPQTSSFPVVINLGASLKVCRLTWPNLSPTLLKSLHSPPSRRLLTYLPDSLTRSSYSALPLPIMLIFALTHYIHQLSLTIFSILTYSTISLAKFTRQYFPLLSLTIVTFC